MKQGPPSARRLVRTATWCGCAALSALKHALEIDVDECANFGGEVKIIAAILEAPVIEKTLTHLGQ